MVYQFIELRLKILLILEYDNNSGGRMDSTHFDCATSRHTSQHTSFIVETCVDLFSYRLTNIVRFSRLSLQYRYCHNFRCVLIQSS